MVIPVTQVPYFKVSTFTGIVPDASTDARVYVDLFGEVRGARMDSVQEDALTLPSPPSHTHTHI